MLPVIHPVLPPSSATSPEAWALLGVERVRVASDDALHGHHDLTPGFAQMASILADRTYRPQHRIVAVCDDLRTPESVVGHASVRLPQVGETDVVHLDLGVDPAWRRRGIGTALAAVLAERVRETGRTVVKAETSYGRVIDTGAETLAATTGVGSVPADDPATRFAVRYGFTLEQVERQSTLPLPVGHEHLAGLSRTAAAAAGDAYRLHTWVDEIPEAWEVQYARLLTRMSTATPSGGMEQVEDPWDVARLREATARRQATGDLALVVAAEHVPTGELAAYTVVEFTDSRPESVIQDDTLVLPEHRGHRLGMLVKCRLLETLASVRPQARRIHTWNAEENTHMLAINVALGYRPASVSGQWQLRLTDS
ncbi:GNAT family N-acetyltransferase [Mumia sp. zg.B53]|uniref:GNAT family N-acetyltransferase n=1 Tax=Mumia sp. zg.B53 TaxID=2855449 RepID=UPI001C6F2F51|nr:GNAT family N-acetyltransferase [Mumia sp. zg.B53]MBW9213852.1 GNAT family N-acetyltransferase [Mumia sp. zg.B53]